MLYTDKVIVVEGRYDKIRLSSIVNALILTTDGFHIFNDREKQQLLKRLARERGLIILTVTHVFIPDIFGKERRKEAPSKEGKLGVEGIDNSILEQSLIRSGAFSDGGERTTKVQLITSADLYRAGLTGGENSAQKRRDFLKKCALPARLTGNTLLGTLNCIMTYGEFCEKTGIAENCDS